MKILGLKIRMVETCSVPPLHVEIFNFEKY
jgi:hypothetical protein